MQVTDCDLGVEAATELASLYDTYEPWADRTESDVRELVANSDEVVGLRTRDDGKLVASARVLTDYLEYGMVYDVLVAEEYRGDGLGHQLMEAVVEHPRLQSIRLSLHCREELVPFYEACGFERFDDGVELDDGRTVTYRWMRNDRREES